MNYLPHLGFLGIVLYSLHSSSLFLKSWKCHTCNFCNKQFTYGISLNYNLYMNIVYSNRVFSVVLFGPGEHPAAMQRGKNSASPIPGRWWGPLSAGLGLSACFPPRTATAAVIFIGILGHLVFTWGADHRASPSCSQTDSPVALPSLSLSRACPCIMQNYISLQCSTA